MLESAPRRRLGRWSTGRWRAKSRFFRPGADETHKSRRRVLLLLLLLLPPAASSSSPRHGVVPGRGGRGAKGDRGRVRDVRSLRRRSKRSNRDRVESSLIIFIARRRPPPPPPPPPPSPVPPSDALPQLHPPRDARSRAMNMRDAETGEMMWEKHAWPSAWRSEEVEARIPADVMNRAAVSREMTFSSAAAIDDFRVSARLHRVLGSRGARAILKDSDSSHSSRVVLRPRRPLTPSPDRATKKFNPFLRSTVATARLPRRALHRRVGLRLRVRDPGQRQHVADDDRERGRGRDVRPDADKRIRCVLYAGPHTTAFAL